MDNKYSWKNFRKARMDGKAPILRPARTKQGRWVRFFFFLTLAVLLVLLAFFGKYFAPYDPLEVDYSIFLQPPDKAHIMGTDNLGRDVFSRVLYGAGNSFSLTFLMIAIVSVIGTTVGLLSGYFGGIVDTVMMRFTDILLAFPNTVFAIAVVGVLGPGLLNTMIAMSLVWWTGFARVARGLAVSIREKDYVMAARFGGASTGRILIKYILPMLLPQILVMATLDVGGMILSLAGLSYLGLASQPPTPEWGYMLNEGRQYIQTAPWLIWFAGLAIFITVVVFNLLGDSLRDVLDPKEE